MNDRIAELLQLVELTRAMLEKAQASLWDEVIALEAGRRERISAFFLTPVEPELASPVAESIRNILAMDYEIATLGLAEKQEAGLALRQMEQGKKAVKAYML
ncbi:MULTISPECIES: flagellar protein FliT [Methylomicrobium]|uniref:Flagellar protein FliT n=1 Tax=Methylomicrobium album BG8 TaxID=686340 RepID=H8GMU9_METAL|nr:MULTISPECIES: flagellar protein FliT [Methylomicrobium]EIC29501.1 Flagellar protein FliT [Methylomicrobium album BG8]